MVIRGKLLVCVCTQHCFTPEEEKKGQSSNLCRSTFPLVRAFVSFRQITRPLAPHSFQAVLENNISSNVCQFTTERGLMAEGLVIGRFVLGESNRPDE